MTTNLRLDAAEDLVDALRAGDEDLVSGCMQGLLDHFECELYQDVGKLTREVHNTVKSLGDGSGVACVAETHIPDAKERLEFVIKNTEKAANETLTAVETLVPAVATIDSDLSSLDTAWNKFIEQLPSELDTSDFDLAITNFAERTRGHTSLISSEASKVVTAQEFQDITGQVIRRTIELVREVEEKLVGLVCRPPKAFASLEVVETTAESSFGPATRQEEGRVQNQDEVDDLLTSLGF